MNDALFSCILIRMPTVEITAERMTLEGDCTGRADGKTVFIPYAVPGERIEAEITHEEHGRCKARIARILEPSPFRTEPFCPYYGTCGGCTMQHITPEFQRKLRVQTLEESFRREGIQIPEIQVVSGPDKGYRARFQFHDGGLMGRRSNEIISIERCPCATDEINAYLAEIPAEERPRGRVHVFASSMISSVPPGYAKIVIAEPEETAKTFRRKKGQKSVRPRYEGTAPESASACSVLIAGRTVSFDIRGFFQSNLIVLEKAVPLIAGHSSGKNLLDLYAGAGTFSVFLSDQFERTVLVEHNKGAVVYAEQNMAGKPHESYGLSAGVWASYHAARCVQSNGAFDAAVIDPPRSGMEPSVRTWLSHSGIPLIKSISCSPAAHARDVKFLTQAGYKVRRLLLLDFYPQTGHVESFAELEK